MVAKRAQIVQVLKDGLQKVPSVFALWLEGADSTNSVDSYSDLDIWLDVEDGQEGMVLRKIESVLLQLGTLDFAYELEHPHPKIRQKIFHLKNSPESLLLDVCIQSHSRKFKFVTEYVHENPKVIFDKARVIKFKKINEAKLNKELKSRIYHLENMFRQDIRVITKIKRNDFLEAMGYYHKWVLGPLVELLRIKYAPYKRDYYLKHISRDLPKQIVKKLEYLYGVTSLDDMTKKMRFAKKLFNATLRKSK